MGSESGFTFHVTSDRRSHHAQILHRVLELLSGQIGKLQRGRGHRRETIVMAVAPGREPFILNVNNLRGEIAIRPRTTRTC